MTKMGHSLVKMQDHGPFQILGLTIFGMENAGKKRSMTDFCAAIKSLYVLFGSSMSLQPVFTIMRFAFLNTMSQSLVISTLQKSFKNMRLLVKRTRNAQ